MSQTASRRPRVFRGSGLFVLGLCTAWACVPAGNSTPSTADAGAAAASSASSAAVRQSIGVMTAAFEDSFDRTGGAPPAPSALTPLISAILESGAATSTPADGAAAEASAPAGEAAAGEGAVPLASAGGLGPDLYQAQTSVWHIENGRLCGQGAHNHGVWLKRVLPVNARIEFDAISDSPDGDLKAEVWGDGQSAATSISYTNATSYLSILGGWKNSFHVLARLNEHGTDRKEIKVDKDSDDPRQKPVTRGQIYHFKIERTDGKTVHWFVDGLEYLSYPDAAPLVGAGHDHFGFNDWEVKVCFDNVKVTPL